VLKDTLLSIIIFCIVLAAVAALCALSFIVYLIGAQLYMLPAVGIESLIALVPFALTETLLPAVLLSLIFALSRARRRPGLVFLTYLALGGLAFAALFSGPRLISSSLSAQIGAIKAKSVVGLRDLETPGTLAVFENAYVYFEKRVGATLQAGVCIEPGRPAPRLTYFERAALRQDRDGARLELSDPPRLIALTPRTEETAPFAPGAEAGSVFGFFSGWNERYLGAVKARETEYLIVCLLMVALVLSSSLFLRITRWPLANLFITLLALALILALHNFISIEIGRTLPGLTGPQPVFALIPNAVLIFFSAVFFLLDFVFLRERRREIPGA
jgi:hypothetical protein